MQPFNRKLLFASLMLITFNQSALADDLLTGDTKLACEAILCLSSATQPAECQPSISRYFSIVRKKFGDTLNARKAFLNLCPSASQSPDMNALTQALVMGAGRCDANSLNSSLRAYTGDENHPFMISNQLPGYCRDLFSQPYTNFQQTNEIPKYVGRPEREGLWVESRDYQSELAKYQRKLKAEDEAKKRLSEAGG